MCIFKFSFAVSEKCNYSYLIIIICVCLGIVVSNKSLKIPNGLSKSVYRIRTDNTMARRKGTKGQTTIYKTYT